MVDLARSFQRPDSVVRRSRVALVPTTIPLLLLGSCAGWNCPVAGDWVVELVGLEPTARCYGMWGCPTSSPRRTPCIRGRTVPLFGSSVAPECVVELLGLEPTTRVRTTGKPFTTDAIVKPLCTEIAVLFRAKPMRLRHIHAGLF